MKLDQSIDSRDKDWSTYINEALEEDRARIAREMHDELGQQLTVLKMDLDTILQNCRAEDKDNKFRIKNAMIFIDQIIDTVRRISLELRPSILDDLGLLAALEWQCDSFQKKTNIECLFQHDVNRVSFEKGFTNAAFRILQEALTNVRRHAQATKVEVCVTEHNSLFIMEVRDNGKGCSSQDLTKRTLGILGMTERARLMGGELTVSPGKNNGTMIKATLLLNS